MRLSGYLRSKAIALVIFFVTVAAVALLLWVSGVATGVTLTVCVLLVVALIIALAWDFLIRRRFYSDLAAAVENGRETYYVTARLERPAFLEGQLGYDALAQGSKDMNDRIAEYRIASVEYRDYVETWIHEIKTPIAASRLLLENNESDLSRRLEHELDRIESHIEQALYYARSTAVEKDYSIKQVDLEQLVKAAVKKHSRLLIESGIMPRFELSETSVYADPKWLDFVLGQIIFNAVKYHRPRTESLTPEIAFVVERGDAGFDTDKVLLRICDNGIGIPATDISRVFDKGFTGENGRSFAKSTGIGLYLCKKLCEKMKLKLSITSVAQNETDAANPEPGTTLTIEFPLNRMFFLD
ncbi:MAG TPA: sensor histidine kinase [Coriobacteriia bacterium]|nr:sensor histidine kinase [Coriobacteriia bacterium]